MFEKGEKVGPYQIIEQLGQGGMATVYKAYHENLDRHVAIKVLHPALKQTEGFMQRFEREAKLIAKLEHPHIVPIYDSDEHNGNPYLVMRFIEGETLKSRMKKGPLSMPRIVSIITSVGSALEYAHQHEVLHRDIKPSNVMLTEDNKVFLTDFGLARIAQSGESTISKDMMIGTPQYISPEQAKGEPVDAGTDIYSLGVVIYELMVGQVPYSADTPYAIIHDHIFSPLPMPRDVNPQVPEAVERFLLKVLAKQRSDRYATVGEMVDAFTKAVEEAGEEEIERSLSVAASNITPVPVAKPSLEDIKSYDNDTVASAKGSTEAKPRRKEEKKKEEEAAAESKPRVRRGGVLWPLVGLALLLILLLVGGLTFSEVVIEEYNAVYGAGESDSGFVVPVEAADINAFM